MRCSATWRIPANGYVVWSAYLTAKARIELHKQLVADGQDGLTAIYCDTDSCYSTTPRAYNLGSDLGQWLPEGTFENREWLWMRWIDRAGNPLPTFEESWRATESDLRATESDLRATQSDLREEKARADEERARRRQTGSSLRTTRESRAVRD